jgi:cytochrome c oxidase subunit IV
MSDRANDRIPSVWELAKGPLAVWAVLLALLAVSAGSAYVPLGPFNAAVNLAVAAVMIFLLAAFLMNLRWSNALVRIIAASGLLWLAFMFVLTFTDYLSRT